MEKETRRERFLRIAPKRVNKIIDALGVLANCANKQNYEYDEEDVQQIFAALEDGLAKAQAEFLPDAKKKHKKRFILAKKHKGIP